MPSLLVFDFDGVLVDGMAEYWWSARRAALQLDRESGNTAPPLQLPEEAPVAFARLRPLIHKGWEMVLMAAELGRPDTDVTAILQAYPEALATARERWGWSPERLQEALESVRREALASDRQAWLGRHRFFPGVEERLRRLDREGVPWAVLTTKGGAFTAELLAAADLHPSGLYGHEAGSKPEVLLRLLRESPGGGSPDGPPWFVEDRRPTLELVRQTPGLDAVRCLLVSWGYLAPGDGDGLDGLGIAWLTPETFQRPLADWPEPSTVRAY